MTKPTNIKQDVDAEAERLRQDYEVPIVAKLYELIVRIYTGFAEQSNGANMARFTNQLMRIIRGLYQKLADDEKFLVGIPKDQRYALFISTLFVALADEKADDKGCKSAEALATGDNVKPCYCCDGAGTMKGDEGDCDTQICCYCDGLGLVASIYS